MRNYRSPWFWIAAFVFLCVQTCLAQAPRDAGAFVFPGGAFPILPWELPPHADALFSDPNHGLASVVDCGFTVEAFVRPQHIAQCETLKMKAIFAAEDFPIPWRTLSDQQIADTVKKLVGEAGSSNAVIGYFLADEPGLQDFPALGKAVAAVKKFAPGKLAYINLFPDYATIGAPDLSQLGTANYTEYLERFVSEVKPQFISYDNYRIEGSNDQTDPALTADYYTNLLEIRRVAQKHKLPFWNIVSSNQIVPEFTPPSPANFLLQAYTTLAAGAQGLTWYTYYSNGYAHAPVDKSGSRTSTWSYLNLVNDQVKTLGPVMRPLTSTGVYFSSPPLAPSLPKLPGRWVSKITCAQPLMIGEFAGPSDQKYAMIVNLSLRESAHVTFDLSAEIRRGDIRQISPVDAALTPLEAANALWLAAGQGALLKLP